ncbi:hypothetical protein HY498_05630, partial [Candidatus Woesearchaeota archaeon]|nr:hypothetical protein [Candidatus Woesearchaeota archaeon]
MKKRLLGLFYIVIIIAFSLFINAAIRPESIKEIKKQDITVISDQQIQESSSSTFVPDALSVKTQTDTISGAKGVNIDKATGHTTFDYADFYSLNQLDAEQLKDARLRDRVLTFSHAGSVHLKDPITIDLDEIGPSTFWFEGNDLRAMEITFPKDKSYTLNNPLSHDDSKFFDLEHMLDSDKDGITDEVER